MDKSGVTTSKMYTAPQKKFRARDEDQVLGKSETPLIRDLDSEISWAKTSNVSAARYPEVAVQRAGSAKYRIRAWVR